MSITQTKEDLKHLRQSEVAAFHGARIVVGIAIAAALAYFMWGYEGRVKFLLWFLLIAGVMEALEIVNLLYCYRNVKQPTFGPPAEMEFPVLAFSQNLVTLHRAWPQLARCSALGFKRGYFNKLEVVDRRGARFRKVHASRGRLIWPPFSPSGFLDLMFGNPRHVVDLELLREGQEDVSDTKARVTKSIEKENEIWTARSDFDEFIAELEKCRTREELFRLLS